MKIVRIFFGIIILLTAVKSASAIGVGLNIKDTGNSMQASHMTLFSSPLAVLLQHLVGTDLTLDTAVAKNRLFNYRLSIDCENIDPGMNYTLFNNAYSINRFTCSNTFGFGFFRSNLIRLWVGPQVGLCYEYRYSDKSISDTTLLSKFGSVVGINFHADDAITLSLETGFRTPFSFDFIKSKLNTYSNSKIEPIMGFKIIFRSRDSYYPFGIN